MDKRVLISGASGLVGSAIIPFVRSQGYQISRLIRSSVSHHAEDTIHWDIEKKEISYQALEGHDTIIHLAGTNIANRRWTDSYKKIILNSRVESTALLVQAIRQLRQPPKNFFCASAVGYYGPYQFDIKVNEDSPAGDDFLATVCQKWEEATRPAAERGVRVIYLRFGMVLSPHGGALTKMLPIFKLGLGGQLGNGKQMMSWIALNEIPKIITFLMDHPQISGAVNCVAPQAVSNKEFTQILGEVLHRPTFLPAPALALRLLLGEMAETLLLSGANVIPQKLLNTGYQFDYPELKSTLKILFSSHA